MSAAVLPKSARTLLAALFPDAVMTDTLRINFRGLLHGGPKETAASQFVPSVAALDADGAAAELLVWNRDHGRSVYVAPGVRRGAIGTKDGVAALTAFWADLDAKDFVRTDGRLSPTDRAEGKRLARQRLLERLPAALQPSIIVDTGGGLQCWWLFKEPAWLGDDGYTVETLEGHLKGLATALGGDPAVAQVAALMRLPGFKNMKYPDRPMATILEVQLDHRFNPSDFDEFWIDLPEAKPRTDDAIDGTLGPLAPALTTCGFLQWCRDHPADVREPLWYAMCSNLVRLEGGRDAAHAFSRGHPGYTAAETDQKLDQARAASGPISCAKIRELGFPGCPADGHGVPAPAWLAWPAKEHRTQSPAMAEILGGPPERPAITEAGSSPLSVPEATLLGVGRDFADLYHGVLEVPRSFLYFAFATYFGALVAKMVTLDSTIAPEPRLYTVLLGESANTRKSTALRVVDAFFRTLSAPWSVPVLFGAGSAEGLAAELADSPDCLLHYDEFKSFVDKAKAEHSVVLPMVSTLFERGEYDNRIKEKKLSVRGARLSLLAACTTDTYATLFDHQFHAIGFLNRLWLVADRSPASVALPAPLPFGAVDVVRQTVQARLTALDRAYTRNGLLPVRYRLTPAARTLFTDWYQARTGTVFEKRLDTYGHRLMVLLTAMLADRDAVEADIAAAVVAMLDSQLATRRACDPIDAENAVARMEEKIRRVLTPGPLTDRDLKRAVHVDRVGLWVFETAVANLLTAEELLIEPVTTLTGRPQRLYRLRPVATTGTTPDGTDERAK